MNGCLCDENRDVDWSSSTTIHTFL
ncbi:hypothetical protein CAEBREN_11910 [Caenorhabditis brenneri]|uniref:Uncharacterized protein n=1 Tax=Caenorhabditis brenneri TaxID=135651 RepID=G0MD26_CAEBE|nr:hypothetical protein CAEBREN_11910 [Caenorhabditis brenneri]